MTYRACKLPVLQNNGHVRASGPVKFVFGHVHYDLFLDILLLSQLSGSFSLTEMPIYTQNMYPMDNLVPC